MLAKRPAYACEHPIKNSRSVAHIVKHLLLIRHGIPHEGHSAKPNDPPLHPDGHDQAERLAQALAHEGIDRIVCSPQQRAKDTAAPLVRLTGLTLEVYDGLAEIDRHAGAYRSAETIRAEGPERWAEFVASPARFMGLDPDEYRESVVATLREIAYDSRGSRVAVFSHGMTIKTMICAVLGLTGNGFSLFSTAHCSVTRLVGTEPAAAAPLAPRMKVESVNESLIRGLGRV
jgi:2,3-bisphosphoglycerate-dependent phosphoglycerate mutase